MTVDVSEDETTTARVSRTEVAAHIRGAFASGPADTARIREQARATGARTEVLEALEELPSRSFLDLRQVWTELPEMPVNG